MTTKLVDLCRPVHENIFEDREWLLYLRDLIAMDVILKHCVPHEVKAIDAASFRGDFFGYLRWIGVEPICDWVHLEINGMKHPSEWDETREVVIILPTDKFFSFFRRYQSVNPPKRTKKQ